jgi:hypothetical protein
MNKYPLHHLVSLFLLLGFMTSRSTILAQSEAIDFYPMWDIYKEPNIKHKFFKEKDIARWIESYEQSDKISSSIIGHSFEGRPIRMIRYGSGDIPVLLWTQMHGDEPTATMAAADIVRFLITSDSLDYFRDDLAQKLSIYFIFMLNPDGVEVYKRRNALDVDLNRDAVRLQSPESQLLKFWVDSLKPKFGFNLHDQSAYYTAGGTNLPATISFLAPAYNEAKDLNDTRANAMRLIVQLNRTAQKHLPGHVGRYNDTFEPRAFGDNIQAWGTSTILIESGGFPGDTHKQIQRKLHFTMLLDAFHSIADKRYLYEGLKEYFDIPFNQLRAHDLVLQGVVYPFRSNLPVVDIAIRRQEFPAKQSGDVYYMASINDIGDLSTQVGFQHFDASGLTWVSGKLLKGDWRKIQTMPVSDILSQGYSHILVRSLPSQEVMATSPFHFILHERDYKNILAIGRNPYFFLHNKSTPAFYVANGVIKTLDEWNEMYSGKLLSDLLP